MKRIGLQNRERHAGFAQQVVRLAVQTQQFDPAPEPAPIPENLTRCFMPARLRSIDKCALPLDKRFGDGRQQKRLVHAPQRSLEDAG